MARRTRDLLARVGASGYAPHSASGDLLKPATPEVGGALGQVSIATTANVFAQWTSSMAERTAAVAMVSRGAGKWRHRATCSQTNGGGRRLDLCVHWYQLPAPAFVLESSLRPFTHALVNRVMARLQSTDEDGQTLVEYGLLLALIAIIVVVALLFLGPIVSGIFQNVGSNLAGS
jgi:pilus assembly protein Flp/PilA